MVMYPDRPAGRRKGQANRSTNPSGRTGYKDRISLVCLVHLVYLVCLVLSLSADARFEPDKPDKRDKPDRLDKPNSGLLTLTDPASSNQISESPLQHPGYLLVTNDTSPTQWRHVH